MNLTINNHNELSLLVAEGAVQETGLRAIDEALERLPPVAEKHVLLDCTGMRKFFYSSIGFSGFVNHLLSWRARQARLVLFGCDQQTLRLLRLLRLERAFEYAPTLDEAYLILKKAHPSSQATVTSNPECTSYA